MCTDANIEIDGNVATLRDKNDPTKYITVEFISNHGIKIGSERALPLPTSPQIPEQYTNEGYYRLYAIVEADGDVTVTAKINTHHENTTNIADYDVNMDEWQV